MRRTAAALILLLCIFAHTAVPASAAPAVSAQCAILTDGEGRVLYEKDADRRCAIASTTKILTALIVLERLAPDAVITVPECAVGTEGSSAYLREGETLTVLDLLYALMLQSANDAAVTLAVAAAGSVEAFADLMNAEARAIGMTGSHFANPHGLPDDRHYSTARDMALLTRCALQNKAFRTVVSSVRADIVRGDTSVRLVNHNKLLIRYPDAIGVKTGYTRMSGRCLVGAAERDGITMIAVTLNAPDDWNDHAKLLDYGFSLFCRVTPYEAGEFTRTVAVAGGEQQTVTVCNPHPLTAVVGAEHGQITVDCELRHLEFAPVEKDRILGFAVLREDGREIARTPLIAAEEVRATENKRGGLLGIWDALMSRKSG